MVHSAVVELGLRLRTYVILFLVFAAAGLALYAPALSGEFISDDVAYIPNNTFIHELDADNVLAILDPFGDAAITTYNYAPVHLLLHAVEWKLFGTDTTGYHVVNVLVHAFTSVLLVAVFAASGIPPVFALFGATVFFVHPANVEAVAWIFQLKTSLALGLSLAALLAFPRRRVLGVVLFALALLTKISAVYALPVLAVWLYTRGSATRRDWGWWAAWVAVFAAFSVPEFAAFNRTGEASALHQYPDVATHVRSIVSIAGRYFVMAFTSIGVSPTHEPAPAFSWGDPRWLFGLVVVAAVALRSAWSLWKRSEEAGYWVWVGAAFAPISQIFPFTYPVGDRYLYFILPGLLGVAFYVGRDAVARLESRAGAGSLTGVPGRRVAAALALAVVAVLAFRTARITPAWRSETFLMIEAAKHYPNGRGAIFLRARRAAYEGDVQAMVASLNELADVGFALFYIPMVEPAFAPFRNHPGFEAVLARMAENWMGLAKLGGGDELQEELRTLALAHVVMGDERRAIEVYEQALERGGPYDELIRQELAAVRARGGGTGGRGSR
jgi:hypothetical protein